NRCIDNSLAAKLVEESLSDLVSAVVLGNLLTHQKNLFIAGQLFTEGLIKCFADRDCRHDFICGPVRLDWRRCLYRVPKDPAMGSLRQSATSLRLLRGPCDRARPTSFGLRCLLRAGWQKTV